MRKIAIIFLMLISGINIFAEKQDSSYVFYCHDDFLTGSALFFENNFVIADLNYKKVFLLTSNKIIVDTMDFLGWGSVPMVTVTGKNSFSLGYTSGILNYSIENNKFILQKSVAYEVAKEHYPSAKVSLVETNEMIGFYHNNWIIEAIGDMSIKKLHGGYRAVNIKSGKEVTIVKPISKKELKIKKVYDDNLRAYSFFVKENDIYINYPTLNKCYIFNEQTSEIHSFDFPAIKESNKYSWYYIYDYIAQKDYLVKYFSDKKTTEIYELKFDNMKLKFVLRTKKDWISITNSALETIAKKYNSYCIILIPFYNDKKQKQELKEITVKPKNN